MLGKILIMLKARLAVTFDVARDLTLRCDYRGVIKLYSSYATITKNVSQYLVEILIFSTRLLNITQRSLSNTKNIFIPNEQQNHTI